VSFFPKIPNGLSHIYQLNAANIYKSGYFTPLEVNGYPAAYADLVDGRSQGNCGLKVGVSDQSYFDVLIQGRDTDDVCKAAENVAKAVLTTIQAGQ
jgi:hypothetical protein